MQVNRADYYEGIYWQKFSALFASLGKDFRDSNGRFVRSIDESWKPTAYVNPPTIPVSRRVVRDVRWAVGYTGDIRKAELRHLTGLVSCIEFGLVSRLRWDLSFAQGVCRLNGFPLTCLHMHSERRGREGCYMVTRLYFQLDCREELARLDAVRAIKRLWRSSYKSYFSWLPRDCIMLIQRHILFP
jgi:hypothetical protein